MDYRNADSVIFDLDGTLWDASAACAIAWNQALADSGNSSYKIDDDTVRALSGLKMDDVLHRFFGFIAVEKQDELLDLYKKHELVLLKKYGGPLYQDAREVLAELGTKYKLFVVSNCLSGYIENFIEFHALQNVFADIECAGNTGLPKSDNIKLIVERNSLKSPVYIGDTIWDSEAADKAGLPFIYAGYGFGKIEHAKNQVNSFQELRGIFLS